MVTMKLENNWMQKTLENLEKEKWKTFDSDSRLIKRIKELRKVPLDNFSVEDLRLMIGQHESLEYLIPLAIEKLRVDILSEGDMYKGDLLLAVVNARQDYWDKATEQKGELIELINSNKELIESEGLEIEID
jgi:CDI immunity proteins